MLIVPASTPLQPRKKTLEYLESAEVSESLALLGIRGYYKRTMGDPTRNDRGIYDDAIFVYSPFVHATFNANTDPSKHRPQVAVLNAGKWYYKKGIHGLSRPRAMRYTALVQAGPVTVRRDEGREDSGWFGINIHRGGINSTSSLGCQTIFHKQWSSFIALVLSELKRCEQKILPYVLVDAI